MIIDWMLLIIGLIVLLIASYSDIKTTEIPDWLSYFLIISGISLRGLYSLTTNNISYTTAALTSLGIFFLIGNFMYYAKQWGGGDAKLLMGISVIFATYPTQFISMFPFRLAESSLPITIFINILLVGMIYSLFFIIYMALKHNKEFIQEFKLYITHTKKSRRMILVFSILLIVLGILSKNIFSKIILITAALFAVSMLYFWIFIKAVEKSCMYKYLPPQKLLEGDWLTKDIYHNKKLIIKKPIYGLTRQHIDILKKLKIKKVEIKQGVIFTPTFPVAVIISLIIGNPINYLI